MREIDRLYKESVRSTSSDVSGFYPGEDPINDELFKKRRKQEPDFMIPELDVDQDGNWAGNKYLWDDDLSVAENERLQKEWNQSRGQ